MPNLRGGWLSLSLASRLKGGPSLAPFAKVETTALSSSETGNPAPRIPCQPPISIYHLCQASFCLPKIPQPAFVSCLYAKCTYMSVFHKIFCSPIIRLQPGRPHLSFSSQNSCATMTDFPPDMRENRNLIGAVSKCVHRPEQTSKPPQTHFQRLFGS